MPPAARRLFWLAWASTAVWAALPFAIGAGPTTAWGWPVLGALVVAGAVALDPAGVRAALRPRRREVALGLGLGLGMALLTGPAFALSARALPVLRDWVEQDYAAIAPLGTWAFLPRMAVVVLAEELLWRHAWLAGAGHERRAVALAALASVLTYAAAQTGAGSPAVPLLALSCGAAWTGLRLGTGSLVAPLLCHAIWSPAMMLFFPVVAR